MSWFWRRLLAVDELKGIDMDKVLTSPRLGVAKLKKEFFHIS